eukprot:scaffold551233_cov15-Prasinocladus_malaysianus.AAC.1
MPPCCASELERWRRSPQKYDVAQRCQSCCKDVSQSRSCHGCQALHEGLCQLPVICQRSPVETAEQLSRPRALAFL